MVHFTLLLIYANMIQPEPPALPRADLVLIGGKIWTGNPDQPEVAALAIQGDRIVSAGTDFRVQKLAGPKTRIVDLKGRRVVPGFYDSHVHLLGAGLQLSQISLRNCQNEAEFGRRLQEFDRQLPPGRWLLGGDWDHDRTFQGQLPTAAMLDKYVPQRLVFLRRYDGHMALVNSRTLHLGRIAANTPDPPGGAIYRKPNTREPSGVLRDNAMGLVGKFLPLPSQEEIREAVHAALVEARTLGVTSVQDMDGSEAATRSRLLEVYRELAHSRQLTLRIDLRWPLAEWRHLEGIKTVPHPHGDWVRLAGVKGFVDGSLGSSTAKMYQPYLHEKDNTGVFVTPLERLRMDIQGADKAGLSVAVHAIGDRANAELLDLFAQVARENGPRDRRFRIEHAQHLRTEDFRRFKQLGVVASMQPYHLIDDGRWAEGRIGPQRCATSYALRSLRDAGAQVAFGSDWPVAPLNPLLGIDAAVNRRTLDGKHHQGWFPGQKISVAEALGAYTRSSAHAGFEEKERGTLEPGKLADLVVLSSDILDPDRRDPLGQTKVLLTMVGGKVVYEAPEK